MGRHSQNHKDTINQTNHMKDIVIELNDRETIRVQTRPSGDLEVVSSRTKPAAYFQGSLTNPGGVHDTLIALIPKSQRAKLANFIATA